LKRAAEKLSCSGVVAFAAGTSFIARGICRRLSNFVYLILKKDRILEILKEISSMNYEQFTLKAQEALRDAASIAQKNDHSSIEPEHLLSRVASSLLFWNAWG